MELLIIKLCEAYPSPVKVGTRRIDRWNPVAKSYRHIRDLVAMNPIVQSLKLYSINNATLSQWYTKRTNVQDKQMLERNIRLPEPPISGDTPLPAAHVRVPITERPPVPPGHQHQFTMQPYTVGTSGRVRKQIFQSQMECQGLDNQMFPQNLIQSAPLHTYPLHPYYIQPLSQPAFSHQDAVQSPVPKSTEWCRKQKERQIAAGELVRSYSQRRENPQYKCHKCMKLRDKESHTQVQGKWFCQATATESLEEFLASEKPKEKKCRKRKQDNPLEDTL